MQPLTKTTEAYWALRKGIVTGSVSVDDPLDERELSERFGYGRTPTREALKRLTLEQFVIWPAHRTPHVRAFDIADLSPLYEARLALEEPVARLAAGRISNEEAAELVDLADEMSSEIEPGAAYEIVELDHRIHLAIARATHNRFLAKAVENLNCGSLRLWYLSMVQLEATGSENDHRAIVDAIIRHDAEAAAFRTREHVLSSYDGQLRLANLIPLSSLEQGIRRPSDPPGKEKDGLGPVNEMQADPGLRES